jgi:hypothetical protein
MHRESTVDTLWLRLRLAEKCFYFSISYNPPSAYGNYDSLLESLHGVRNKLPCPSATLHMGDFNSRIPKMTGDHASNTNGNILLSHLLAESLKILSNTESPAEYTYDCHLGKSIGDLFLCRSTESCFHSYNVHSSISFGSWHRSMSVRMDRPTDPAPPNNIWGTSSQPRIVVTEEGTPHYHKLLDLYLEPAAALLEKAASGEDRDASMAHIREASEIITTAIYRAGCGSFDTALPKPILRKTVTPACAPRLITEKMAAIEASHGDKHSRYNELMEKLNHSLDNDFKKKNKRLWTDLENSNLSNNQDRFWRLYKQTKAAESAPPFPHYITIPSGSGEKKVTNKKKIFSEMFAHINDIGDFKDSTAIEFLEKHGLSREEVLQKQSAYKREAAPHIAPPKAPTHSPKFNDDELDSAVKSFKPKKRAGVDNITNELLKAYNPALATALLSLFNAFLEHDYVPPSLLEAALTLAHKEGDLHLLSNYRPLVMMNTILKLYEKLIDTRIRNSTMHMIHDLQGGSQAGKGCTDSILILQELLHQNPAAQHILCSYDLSKAFDRVNRDRLWTKMEKMGIDSYLIRAVARTYDNAFTLINIGNSFSRRFAFGNGIKQGSVLSPLLFLIYINDVIPSLVSSNQGMNIHIGGQSHNIPCILFVDDILLIAPNSRALTSFINILEQFLIDNLAVSNASKTSLIARRMDGDIKSWMEMTRTQASEGNCLKYLGVILHGRNRFKDHIKGRITKATTKVNLLKLDGLRWGYIPPATCITLIQKLVITKLTHEFEIITLDHNDLLNVDRSMARAYRGALNLHSRTPTKWVLWEAGQMDAAGLYQRAKFRYWRRLAASENDSLQANIARDVHSLLHCQVSDLIAGLGHEPLPVLMDPAHPEFPTEGEWKEMTKEWLSKRQKDSLESDQAYGQEGCLPPTWVKPDLASDRGFLSLKCSSTLGTILRLRGQTLGLPSDPHSSEKDRHCLMCHQLRCSIAHLAFECPGFGLERDEFFEALSCVLDQECLDVISSRDKHAMAALLSGLALGESSMDALILTASFFKGVLKAYDYKSAG